MALPPPIYDLIVLLDPSFEEETRTKILADAEELIAEHGEIVGAQDWGTRKLSYEIEKKPEADYHLIQFQGPAALIAELDRTLRITDGVVRHRIIKLRPGSTPVKHDDPFPAAEPMSVAAGDDRDRDRDRDR
jgi:small subunit ribosomal protein S6